MLDNKQRSELVVRGGSCLLDGLFPELEQMSLSWSLFSVELEMEFGQMVCGNSRLFLKSKGRSLFFSSFFLKSAERPAINGLIFWDADF